MCSCELRSAAVSSKISVSLGGPIGVRCGYGADGRPADFIFLFSLACKLQERGLVRWSSGVFYGEMVTNRGHRKRIGRLAHHRRGARAL